MLLDLADLAVALLDGVGVEALPGQRAAQEVHEHVADGLQVVAAALLVAEVGGDAHVAGGARQALVVDEGDVFACVCCEWG